MSPVGVLENAGIAAKVPVIVRESADPKSPSGFTFGPLDAYDAVVLLGRSSGIPNQNVFVQVTRTPPKTLCSER